MSPRQDRQTPGAPRLTRRERQIARAVAQGITNREIAARLGTTEKTVRNQLTVLYQKLGVRSRLQLGVLLARNSDALDAERPPDSSEQKKKNS